jgi:repressor LexA
MRQLTWRQREVLEFIKSYIRAHRYPPTIREVADGFGISIKGSYDHIKALEKKAYIKCNLKRSRAIEVLERMGDINSRVRQIPILGTVAAGRPLFASENFDGAVEFAPNLIDNGKHFAVRVKGDSMKDAGIFDGDLAIIKHQQAADNGEIVVAMVDDAVTLKRIFIEKNRVMLKAENHAYPPIFTQDAKILGKLSCILRKYS